MLIKIPNKEQAFRAVINVWLADKTKYCNNCGIKESDVSMTVCCEDPQIGTNFDVTKAIVVQNAYIRETRRNDFASTKDKSLRFGVSLPPALYTVLDNYKKMNNQVGLFQEDGEMVWFAKKFPMFATCKRV